MKAERRSGHFIRPLYTELVVRGSRFSGALNLICHTEYTWENGAEEVSWTQNGGSVGGWGKFSNEGSHVVFLAWCFWGNKIKEDEISRACGMYREEKKCLQNLGERILTF